MVAGKRTHLCSIYVFVEAYAAFLHDQHSQLVIKQVVSTVTNHVKSNERCRACIYYMESASDGLSFKDVEIVCHQEIHVNSYKVSGKRHENMACQLIMKHL